MRRIAEIIFKYKVHILILVGILLRVLFYTYVPGGNNHDECFAGYEAWNIMTTGHDSWGHYMPMYLVAWGSGMNALNSYLMIPFIALFGLKIWVDICDYYDWIWMLFDCENDSDKETQELFNYGFDCCGYIFNSAY